MKIIYSSEREFTREQLQELFLSVGWLSGNYPERLYKALNNCETVFTAWADGRLIGLINAIDDGELTAYIHYLLVEPEFQKCGIAKILVDLVKEKYNDYLYLILIAENQQLVGFYNHLGFEYAQGTFAMSIQHR
ncbi:MAG: GNAT family N-acetyltransferase [Eubacteriales bacterium]|nr:GNAT family N-acetyltransferase [Eubacteriales bacterium]